MLGKLDSHMQENETRTLSPQLKTSSKWVKDWSVRSETTKLLKENLGEVLQDTKIGKAGGVGGIRLKSTDNKSRNRQREWYQNKNLSLKRQPIE